MSNLTEKDFKIEIEDGLGDIFEVSFTRSTTWTRDNHYGEDADGNRGTSVDLIDEDTATDLRVKFGEKYTPIGEVNSEVRTRIEEAVDLWLQNNNPDLAEDDVVSFGPDPEDRDR